MISILDYPFVSSPHFSSRKGHGVLGSVLHYTAGGSASGTVSWFLNPASKVSSHFVGDRDGSFTQTVPLDKAAWHAGISEMIRFASCVLGAAIENLDFASFFRKSSSYFIYFFGWSHWVFFCFKQKCKAI